MEEFSFLWFIENYKYCTVMGTGDLVSPEITPEGRDGTTWFLSLYHYGPEHGFGNGIYLTRSTDSAGPERVSRKLEISFITSDGHPIFSEECEHTFKKGTKRVFGPYLDIQKFYEGKITEYTIGNTVCVRCKIWRGEGSVQLVKQCTARTRISVERVSFLHRVRNFSALRPCERNILQIPSQSGVECVFTSIFYINDVNNEGVFVDIVPSNRNYQPVQKKWSLIDVSGNITEFFNWDNRFMSLASNHYFPNLFIPKMRKVYLPNDELSLLCECTYSTGVNHVEIEETLHGIPPEVLKQKLCFSQSKDDRKAEKELSSHNSATEDTKLNRSDQCFPNMNIKANTCSITSNEDSANSFGIYNQVRKNGKEEKHNATKNLSMYPSALEDLKAVYNDQLLTDIVLKTATESFPAHKIVLCARSSVFRAMLTNDMREKNTDCIRVADLENETVQQLLVFLYSDSLENLQWESAIQLYYAADKYAVEKLKVLCSSFLVDNLHVSRASEVLLLADTHNDSNLKNIVQDFIVEHDEDIFCSEEWEKLNEMNPQLVLKTIQLKYKRKKGGK